MMAHVSGDAIVVDGVTVAMIVDRRSNEREALIDVLRDGVALNDCDKIADLRDALEDAEDDASRAYGERDTLLDGVIEALALIEGDDAPGAIKLLRSLI